MKILIILITLLTTTLFSYSQEYKTIFAKDSSQSQTFRGFGGPLIMATQFNNELGIMFGGKGGAIINRKLGIGGVGMALVSKHKINDNSTIESDNSPLIYSYASGGVFLEYYFNMQKPIHISIPLNIMIGGASIKDENSNVELESTNLFILEPGINLAFTMTKVFIPALHISYRHVFGKSLSTIDNKDISGLNIGLVLKFGDF